MEQFLLCLLFYVYLFQNVQSDGWNLLKYYEVSVKDLVTSRLSETKYCETILLPSEHALKTSLDSTFVNAKSGIQLNGNDRVDHCCRALQKCDAHRQIDLNETIAWHIRHCECLQSFQKCLMHLNTSLSNEVAFVHSLNATKCYRFDHPIVKCIKFDTYAESKDEWLGFIRSTERDKFFKRCREYELDETQQRIWQIVDVPYAYAIPIVSVDTRDTNKRTILFHLISIPQNQRTKYVDNVDSIITKDLIEDEFEESMTPRSVCDVTQVVLQNNLCLWHSFLSSWV